MTTEITTRTLPLVDGSIATLVRYAASTPRRAVLYVHGFSDYFFQEHAAEHFIAAGSDFYGIDLRRYGRSLRPGETPCYVTDLADHFEELDAALTAIIADGHRHLVVMGHSTGGLITPLWLDARRTDQALTSVLRGLILNSPWLELALPPIQRRLATLGAGVVGAVRPRQILSTLGPVYGESIHRDHHGEWDFDLDLKPIDGFPVRAGWLRAVRRGHRRLHRGLQVSVPVLLLRSARSRLNLPSWSADAMTADTVLEVIDMARYADSVGPDVQVVEIENAVHDIFLSAETARQQAFDAVDVWLRSSASP